MLELVTMGCGKAAQSSGEGLTTFFSELLVSCLFGGRLKGLSWTSGSGQDEDRAVWQGLSPFLDRLADTNPGLGRSGRRLAGCRPLGRGGLGKPLCPEP